MTIITQPLTEKKLSQQKEPLVKHEAPLSGRDVEDPRPMVVTMHARRVGSTTTFCVLVASLLVLTTGIIGGIYLYRQLTQYRLHHFKGWCTIPYLPDSSGRHQQQPLTGHNLLKNSGGFQEYFQEEFDIDIEFQNYERIEVPDFSHGRHGRFIHDFIRNMTGIIDFDGNRCFVMPLNRTLVLPPKSLLDVVIKMKSGYYDVDTEVVRATMRVVKPPLRDLKPLGTQILRECIQKPTYLLEPLPPSEHAVYKRSVGEEELKDSSFMAFSGNKVNQVYIVNLSDLD